MLEKSLLILNVCFLCFGIFAYVQGITTKEKPVEAIKYTPIIEEVLTDVKKAWDSELGDEYFREMYTKAVEDAIKQHNIDTEQKIFFANEVMKRMLKEYPQTPDYYIEKGMQAIKDKKLTEVDKIAGYLYEQEYSMDLVTVVYDMVEAGDIPCDDECSAEEERNAMGILLKKYPCIKYPVFEYSKLKNGKIVVKGKAEISIWNEEKEILAVVDLRNNRVNHCRIGGHLWKKSYTHNFTPFNCLIMEVGESEESE